MMNDGPYIAQGYHGNYVPRAVCVDLEPGVVNNIKVDQYRIKFFYQRHFSLITSTRLLRTASSSAPTTLFGERMGPATAGLKATTQR